MRVILTLVVVALVAVLAAMQFGLLNIDQTQTAQLPSIRVEGGQAPEFRAEVGRVEVGTRNETVQVPEIAVTRPGEAAAQAAAK